MQTFYKDFINFFEVCKWSKFSSVTIQHLCPLQFACFHWPVQIEASKNLSTSCNKKIKIESKTVNYVIASVVCHLVTEEKTRDTWEKPVISTTKQSRDGMLSLLHDSKIQLMVPWANNLLDCSQPSIFSYFCSVAERAEGIARELDAKRKT